MKLDELRKLLGETEISDEQLEQALNGINTHVNDIRDTALEKQKSEFESNQAKEPQTDKPEQTGDDKENETIKALMDRIDALENGKKEEENQNAINKFAKDAKAKGLTDKQIEYFSSTLPSDKLGEFDWSMVPVKDVDDTEQGNANPKDPDTKDEAERQMALLV